jgi:hypothetical protein
MMHDYQPFSVIGFHSCDKEVGLRVLNGENELLPSINSWDWLGGGVYFWEQNPFRALQYATECAQRKQFNKVPIKIPFVIGAIVDLGNCLDLVESSSISVLSSAYKNLEKTSWEGGEKLPINKGNNRALDCLVIESIHNQNLSFKEQVYDTVRCAFPEGEAAYPTSYISSRLHIQVCVRNPACIRGFFLPRPLDKFNPFFLQNKSVPSLKRA